METKKNERKEDAYNLLKREIVNGERKPGDSIDEKEVAARLGISRTPVREAILFLAREGLIEILPRKGTFVSHFSMSEICQIYELRQMLEPQIVRSIVGKITPGELKQWEQYFSELLDGKSPNEFWKQENPELWHDADAAFHLALAGATGNKFIVRQMEELMVLTQRIRFFSNRYREVRLQSSMEEHLEMIHSLCEEDGEKAGSQMQRHLTNTLEGYYAMMIRSEWSDLHLY